MRPPPRPRSLPIEPDTRNTGSAMANERISISQPARPTRSYTPAWLGHVANAACPVERITETASDPKHSWRYAREAASKHDRRSAGWTEGHMCFVLPDSTATRTDCWPNESAGPSPRTARYGGDCRGLRVPEQRRRRCRHHVRTGATPPRCSVHSTLTRSHSVPSVTMWSPVGSGKQGPRAARRMPQP